MRSSTPSWTLLAVSTCLAGIVIGLLSATLAIAERPGVSVLAAASTRDAVEEIAETFSQRTGIKVQVIAAGSNTLAKQIQRGAPADLFLSAQGDWADHLEKEKLVAKRRDVLGNRLVLVVPKGNPAKVQSPADLTSRNVRRIAVAGEQVPAGIYAEQALEDAGIAGQLVSDRKLARGHDVRAALTYVERGEAEAGIVYATDAAITDRVEVVYQFNPKSHDPIVYPLLLLKQGARRPAAMQFYEYLASDDAARVFESYGFKPLESP